MNDLAIAGLLRSLDSDDPNEQASAAIELGTSAACEAKPALRSLCDSENSLVATAAMVACWNLGEDWIDPRRFLEALSSDDESTMQFAVHALSAIGAPVVKRLSPKSDATEREVERILRVLDDIHTAEAYEVVVKIVRSEPDLITLRQSILDDWESDADGDSD